MVQFRCSMRGSVKQNRWFWTCTSCCPCLLWWFPFIELALQPLAKQVVSRLQRQTSKNNLPFNNATAKHLVLVDRTRFSYQARLLNSVIRFYMQHFHTGQTEPDPCLCSWLLHLKFFFFFLSSIQSRRSPKIGFIGWGRQDHAFGFLHQEYHSDIPGDSVKGNILYWILPT